MTDRTKLPAGYFLVPVDGAWLVDLGVDDDESHEEAIAAAWAHHDAIRAAVEAEIVAWLRREYGGLPFVSTPTIATRIERGEYRKGEP